MSKGSFIAIVALLIAIAGAIVAFAAYFRRRSCAMCDGMDDFMNDDGDLDDLDYYATQLDEEEIDEEEPGDSCCSCGGHCCGEAPAADAPAEETANDDEK